MHVIPIFKQYHFSPFNVRLPFHSTFDCDCSEQQETLSSVVGQHVRTSSLLVLPDHTSVFTPGANRTTTMQNIFQPSAK